MNRIKEELLSNIDRIHTTELGKKRIQKNLKYSSTNIVEDLKNKILNKDCFIYQKGKNDYCEVENIRITINSYNYCIITAHIIEGDIHDKN